MAVAAPETMRDLSGGLEWPSLNRVREQGIFGRARGLRAAHGISGMGPWREPLQATGVCEAARLIRDQPLSGSERPGSGR
jgi:hypothetical protein